MRRARCAQADPWDMPIAPLVGAFRIPATAAGVEAKAYEVRWGLRLCAFLPAGSQELCSKTEHALEALIKLKVRARRHRSLRLRLLALAALAEELRHTC